jgi:uncharacterized membrane protein (DUF485 family)
MMSIESNRKFTFFSGLKDSRFFSDLSAYLLLALFMYTAASKFLTVTSFASTLAKSPLIGSYSFVVAWAIPITEMIIGLLLILNGTRKIGLQASFGLMVIFTSYLVYMVLSGSKLPCHCGGVISTMSWQQHTWFNLAFTLIALIGIKFHKSYKA